MTEGEIQPVHMIATCHTPGCPVAEQPVNALMYPNPVEPTYRAVCGRCGQPVTDLAPAA